MFTYVKFLFYKSMKKKYEFHVFLTIGKQVFDFYHQVFTDGDPERFASIILTYVRIRFSFGQCSVEYKELSDEDFSSVPVSSKPYQAAENISWGLANVVIGNLLCYGK